MKSAGTSTETSVAVFLEEELPLGSKLRLNFGSANYLAVIFPVVWCETVNLFII